MTIGEAKYRGLLKILREGDVKELARWVASYVPFYEQEMGGSDAMPNACANALERAGYKEEESFSRSVAGKDLAFVVSHAIAYLIYAIRAQTRIDVMVAYDCQLALNL